LHADNIDGEVKLYWLPASPVTSIVVIQQWSSRSRLPLLTTAPSSSNGLVIHTPPPAMQKSMWQSPDVSDPPKDNILTAPSPPGQVWVEVLYGSGGADDGFVLVQTEAPLAVVSLWLISMNNGTGTMEQCGAPVTGFYKSIYSPHESFFSHSARTRL